MQRAARKLGKRLDRIEPGSMRRLVEHGWPGNIRDLQNVIERAAILADGVQLVVNWELGPAAPNNAALPAPARAPAPAAAAPASNGAADCGAGSLALQALERRHIVEVLRKTRGVIEGPRGAAELLRLKPSTARFRIRKLGIQRSEYISN